jgi:hypothetical protein
MRKQAHGIKKFLESKNQYLPMWEWNDQYTSNFRMIHEKVLRTVIYTTWSTEWFQTDKAIADWTSEFDSWFIKGYEGHVAHTIWKEGVDYIANTLPEFLKYNSNGTADGLKTYLQHYKIGSLIDLPQAT